MPWLQGVRGAFTGLGHRVGLTSNSLGCLAAQARPTSSQVTVPLGTSKIRHYGSLQPRLAAGRTGLSDGAGGPPRPAQASCPPQPCPAHKCHWATGTRCLGKANPKARGPGSALPVAMHQTSGGLWPEKGNASGLLAAPHRDTVGEGQPQPLPDPQQTGWAAARALSLALGCHLY